MFGWEFPPHNKGGLGTACLGLTKALSEKDKEVILVIPKGGKSENSDHLNLIVTENLYIGNDKIKYVKIDSLMHAYISTNEYEDEYAKLFYNDSKNPKLDIYGKDLFKEVQRYGEKAKIIAQFEDFEVIHCHDWMTFKAGKAAKEVSGKPLVVHVHATEFDRTGGHPNQAVYDIEREGMHVADKIIAVSNYTKDMICKHYDINSEKVEVVHNGINTDNEQEMLIEKQENVVLFLGRMTLQKGPDYFIEAANKVLDLEPNTKFIMAGTGDMYPKMIEKAAELNIGHKILFTGHLKGDEVNKAYQMAKLYVMPSVSEPFGLTALESIKNNTPVMISNQSGVSEVLTNALKADFWDVDEMVNKMVSAIRYPALGETIVEQGNHEIKGISWNKAADKCINVYDSLKKGDF
jgi:glycogen synthase